MKIVIVGAGIIGLSTGLCLKKWNKNIDVTIVSDKLTPETTADGAAGIWSIFLLGDTPIDKQKYTVTLNDCFTSLLVKLLINS